MIHVNENYLKLKAGYLFPEIARRTRAFQKTHPETELIKLGIGDVTLPLPQTVIEAFHAAVQEMAHEETFHGYGPEQGYPFLAQAILDSDYKTRGVDLDIDEVFISDGSKCDTGNIQELFALNSIIAVTDPVYPVYVDTNVMAGRTGHADDKGRYQGIRYLPATVANGFVPEPPDEQLDLIYLCYPNNPTGATATKAQLQQWVNYAQEHKAIILFDAAYEAFISQPDIPHSIYEIKGAKEVAIEFRSDSKTAGFTGTRCAFTIVPKQLRGYTQSGESVEINRLWLRRQTTKFNGVSYPVQRAAAAVYTERGKEQVRKLIDYYMANAKLIRRELRRLGYEVYGGVNAPYLWLKTPNQMDSWEFFDVLLEQAGLVGTPGVGFGPCGQGYFRLSAFGSKENVQQAIQRFSKLNTGKV